MILGHQYDSWISISFWDIIGAYALLRPATEHGFVAQLAGYGCICIGYGQFTVVTIQEYRVAIQLCQKNICSTAACGIKKHFFLHFLVFFAVPQPCVRLGYAFSRRDRKGNEGKRKGKRRNGQVVSQL